VGSRICDHVPLRNCRFQRIKRGGPHQLGVPSSYLIHGHASCLPGRSPSSAVHHFGPHAGGAAAPGSQGGGCLPGNASRMLCKGKKRKDKTWSVYATLIPQQRRMIGKRVLTAPAGRCDWAQRCLEPLSNSELMEERHLQSSRCWLEALRTSGGIQV
jgi:hypothetical protein